MVTSDETIHIGQYDLGVTVRDELEHLAIVDRDELHPAETRRRMLPVGADPPRMKPLAPLHPELAIRAELDRPVIREGNRRDPPRRWPVAIKGHVWPIGA